MSMFKKRKRKAISSSSVAAKRTEAAATETTAVSSTDEAASASSKVSESKAVPIQSVIFTRMKKRRRIGVRAIGSSTATHSGLSTSVADLLGSTHESDRTITRIDKDSMLEASGMLDATNRTLKQDTTKSKSKSLTTDKKRKDSKKRAVPKYLGIGPQKAPDNVQITCRFDYEPCICKDWKETGYCGYGLSCKFLHDRSDYKSGWKIESEWRQFQEKKRKNAKMRVGASGGGDVVDDEEGAGESEDAEEDYEIHSEDDSELGETLPFACFICRQPFVEPIVTKCGHYFCEGCAVQQFKKSAACAACGKNTDGQFQTARKIVERLKQRRALAGETTDDFVEETSDQQETDETLEPTSS